MKRILSLSALAVFAACGSALAADPIMPAPVPTPVAQAPGFDWSGFYAGLNAGYGIGEVADDDGNVFGTYDDADGIIGGAQIGFNHQFDMFVLGVEGDIQLTGLSDEALGLTINLDYFGTLRARAGVPMGNFMPYVTAGVAYGQITGEDAVAGTDESNGHWGWTVGGGVDVAFDESVSFRAEYLYTDLRAEDYFFTGPDGVGMDFHTVRAGVNFHF